jgi:hypothetical protein
LLNCQGASGKASLNHPITIARSVSE